MTRPEVVVLDVNETLSNLESLRTRLVAGGAPPTLLDTWFASTLRDGFALTITGDCAPFRTVGMHVLIALLESEGGIADAAALAAHVLDGFAELDLHPDVHEGLETLRASGIRVVTLTNGATAVSQALLDRAGCSDLVARQLSVEDAGAWKPHPRAYAYAAEQCGVTPDRMVMVAVHPWDLHGAFQAGMRTGWLNRNGGHYRDVFSPPTWQASGLAQLATLMG